jgi:hypothetical protein
MMTKLVSFMVARLRERSTWIGMISLATALGLVLSEAQQEAIVAAGSAVAGLIAALTPDRPAA